MRLVLRVCLLSGCFASGLVVGCVCVLFCGLGRLLVSWNLLVGLLLVLRVDYLCLRWFACVGMWVCLRWVVLVGCCRFECAVWYCLLITWVVFNSVDLCTSFVLFYL